MLPETFRCLLTNRDDTGRVTASLAERRLDELPPGEVLLRVAYSSLNYKDALAAAGHPGVNRTFPGIPGVDAAGVVVQSGVYESVPGDLVLTTGFDLGSNRWGGLAEYVRVPADWIVRLPLGLSLRESMILGTGGLTAAMCVEALRRHGVTPEGGDVVVTGASGGVGSMAVAILARLGYRVFAVSGKPQAAEFLKRLGATEIVPRDAVDDASGKPLLSARWAGGVDTVGGNILSTLLRSTRHDGCVAACGLAQSAELPLTVYPFILRAVTLAGIDAAWCPLALRHYCWEQLAGPWKPDRLDEMAELISLDDVLKRLADFPAGRVMGRIVVQIGGDEMIPRVD
jgi:acrylyl-CoA reductase (NADPH)